jgi:hypothetical protein
MQYLKITIHDNDYHAELSTLGDFLSSFIRDYLIFHTFDIDMMVLKDGILKFLVGANAVMFEFMYCKDYLDYNGKIDKTAMYLEKRLEVNVVDESDIDFKEDEDDGYLYIPICTEEEIKSAKYGLKYFFR